MLMRNLHKLAAVALALVFASGSLVAQEKTAMKEKMYKGYLTDKMCGSGFVKSGDAKIAATKAKKHTKDCALADDCKASGFGVVVGAKFLKFDEAGDKLALEYLNGTKKESNLLVAVNGTMDGNNLKVTSIKDVKK